MYQDLVTALSSIRFKHSEWRFVDLRINIPPSSFGSDAINPHTQYSNPLAILDLNGLQAVGASFTLGEGNQMVCEAADFIVKQLEGILVGDLLGSEKGFYESLTNPLQLRWLSPNAGVPLMAAGLVANTLIDAASKQCGLPAWEYLAKLPTDFLLQLIDQRHLPQRYAKDAIKKILDDGYTGVERRCTDLKRDGLPVYYTTWIGHNSDSISDQILEQHAQRGIKQFKLKIGKQIEHDLAKIERVMHRLPADVSLCVDANQTLSIQEATRWMERLSDLNIVWLEEPFAPDNVALFEYLVEKKRETSWSCEIVTGENCPNHYIASALMHAGIDRFQADPCRMFGLVDAVMCCCIAKLENCNITPHAGGSSLDEQSPHIQLFNLARVVSLDQSSESLTENVGFCSHFFADPVNVSNGRARAQVASGLLVGLSPALGALEKSYREGVTWLEL